MVPGRVWKEEIDSNELLTHVMGREADFEIGLLGSKNAELEDEDGITKLDPLICIAVRPNEFAPSGTRVEGGEEGSGGVMTAGG